LISVNVVSDRNFRYDRGTEAGGKPSICLPPSNTFGKIKIRIKKFKKEGNIPNFILLLKTYTSILNTKAHTELE
jgi:hypothetical protein